VGRFAGSVLLAGLRRGAVAGSVWRRGRLAERELVTSRERGRMGASWDRLRLPASCIP